MKSKVRKIGNSYGIILPKEALEAMQVQEGDVVYMTQAPDAALRMTAADPDFTDSMEILGDIMHRYRNTLRELAK
jgi:putative addiction module antidote